MKSSIAVSFIYQIFESRLMCITFLLALFLSACDNLEIGDERVDTLTCDVPLGAIQSASLDFPYTQGIKQPDLVNPLLVSSQNGTRLPGATIVAGLFLEDLPVAIPLSILHFSSSVNFDQSPDAPDLVVTYSRFTESVRAFDRSPIEGATFRTADELYGTSTVLFDRVEDNSLWSHFAARAICGPKSGQELTSYPIIVMEFQEWEALNPGTSFIELPETSPYSLTYNLLQELDRISYPIPDPPVQAASHPGTQNVLVFPDSLAPVAVNIDSGDALQIRTLDYEQRPVVVFFDPRTKVANAFYSDQAFEISDFSFKDQSSGSTWDFMGRATSGPMQGQSLERVPEVFRTNWGSLSQFQSEASIID